ncbi:MAG TPA: hypothetical protein VFI45_02725 [Candidatus Acidoferrum sp.]|nr:hypothetical protein [Candidatus Acidoferrum sp.]
MTDIAGEAFTVKDAIEISYIVEPEASTLIELRGAYPPGSPILSPDGKRIAIVTQRGVLATNSLEGTIWLLDRHSVDAYLRGKASRPTPTKLLSFRAPGNTPIISDVRWLGGGRQISFLAKRNSPYQRLFIADLSHPGIRAITPSNEYVTAYDVRGATVAYTALAEEETLPQDQPDLIDVTGKDIYSLLYPQRKSIADLDEGGLLTYPSALHVIRSGKISPVRFSADGKRLKLFLPTVALAPDGWSVVTVAPVHSIPSAWEMFQPAYKLDFLPLKANDPYAVADRNPWRVSQYVLVDLRTGRTRPLVDAPAGRSFVFLAPNKAFWLRDGHRIILTNTFLPFTTVANEADNLRRRRSPAIALIDLQTQTAEPITHIKQPPVEETNWYQVKRVLWDEGKEELTVTYSGVGEKAGVPPDEAWRFHAGTWTRILLDAPNHTARDQSGLEFSIQQDLNHPPVLVARITGTGDRSFTWDPNPQLQKRKLGKVSVYHWQDPDGNPWTGLLALPPDFDAKRKYPLVIQTHGFDATTFFSDGHHTTGSGGRALNAKEIVVFQMSTMERTFKTPKDGAVHTAAFRSLIDRLAADASIDRSRVGVIGFSYTCFHVLYAITHDPALFAAASITDGNFMSYMQYVLSADADNGIQSISEGTNGGMPFGPDLTNWLSLAPDFNLDKVRAPLLISALETGELIAEWEVYSGLRRLNDPVDMLWLRKENAPHILVSPRQRYLSQQTAVDWFDFWLNGREEADPAKREQYSRWRELRKLQKQDEGKTKEQSRN